MIAETLRADAEALVARYPKPRSALLPLLHLVQSAEGYVSADGVAFCADVLGLTKAEVGAVATFYTMYKRKPCGEYLVSVCTNLSCTLRGGQDIYDRLSAKLGLHHDETDAEGRFTLEHAECLAACDFAPVLTVNYEFFDDQSVESAVAIVDALARGERPRPTRGDAVKSFREIERELAGMGTRRPVAPAPDDEPHDVVEHFADAVTSHASPTEHEEGDH